MGVGAGLYMYVVVVQSSRSLSHLLMSSCCSISYYCTAQHYKLHLSYAICYHNVYCRLQIMAADYTYTNARSEVWSTRHNALKHASQLVVCTITNNSSAVAEMGDRGHNRHGPKRAGLLCPFRGGAGSPSNTMWPGPRSTSVPSGVFIHPAVWPQ